MKTTNRYEVEYSDQSGRHSKAYSCESAGRAFALCQLEHPESSMIKATCNGSFVDGEGYMEFTPPPIQREPKTEPRPAKKWPRDHPTFDF